MQNTFITLPMESRVNETQSTISSGILNRALSQPIFSKVQRILLPFDLSRGSVRALRIVSELAEKTGATIHLLHVLSPLDRSGFKTVTDKAEDNLEKATERVLKHWVKRLVKDAVKTVVNIRSGDAVDVILSRAIATEADLIVMTSRSFSRHSSELKRSTAERVSRLASCPVLTIPEKCLDRNAYTDALTRKWDRILVPIDFSPLAEQALLYAAQIAKETGATLLLGHGRSGQEEHEQKLHSALKTWAWRLLGDQTSCQIVIWSGGLSLYAILSEAVRSETNLIVLATTGHLWARRLRAGSITDGVLRQAPCPVISINEKVITA